jgi:hypothetical protein
MGSKYRKLIQKAFSVLIVLLVGYWLIGLVGDGVREVRISSIDAQASPAAIGGLEKNSTSLRRFIGGIADEAKDAPAERELIVWQTLEGDNPSFRATMKNPRDGSPIEDFSQWLTWQVFSGSGGKSKQWTPWGDLVRGENSCKPNPPPGSYLILAAIPPFQLEKGSPLNEEELSKLLLEGANKDRRHFVGLRVLPKTKKKSKDGRSGGKPPPKPHIGPDPASISEANTSSAEKQPPSLPGSLISTTEGESEKGALEEVSEKDSVDSSIVPDSVSVPPRRGSQKPTLESLEKLEVEGVLPEIQVTLGDFTTLTHDEIRELHSKYGVVLVLRPSEKFLNLYKNGYAVINPSSGEVSDLGLNEIMNSYGRQAVPIADFSKETTDSLKRITQTNAWLHCDGGYRGLHFGRALLVPYQKYAKDTGRAIREIGLLKAKLVLKRSNGDIEIVAEDLSVQPVEGGEK